MDADEQALRGLVAHLEERWNAGDGEGWASVFAEDVGFVRVDGHYDLGREAVAEAHVRLFDTVFRGSHNVGQVDRVRLLRPDVAVVNANWRLTYTPPGAASQEARTRYTLVCVKDQGRWRIAAFQNTYILPPRPGFPTAGEAKGG